MLDIDVIRTEAECDHWADRHSGSQGGDREDMIQRKDGTEELRLRRLLSFDFTH